MTQPNNAFRPRTVAPRTPRRVRSPSASFARPSFHSPSLRSNGMHRSVRPIPDRRHHWRQQSSQHSNGTPSPPRQEAVFLSLPDRPPPASSDTTEGSFKRTTRRCCVLSPPRLPSVASRRPIADARPAGGCIRLQQAAARARCYDGVISEFTAE